MELYGIYWLRMRLTKKFATAFGQPRMVGYRGGFDVGQGN